MDGEVRSHGQTCYEAYGDHVGWETHDGRPMPLWDDLNDDDGRTRHAWEVAAGAVIRAYADS